VEVQELHDILREDIKDINTQCGKIRDELHALNGQVKNNKFSIKAIWLIFSGIYALGLLWVKSHW